MATEQRASLAPHGSDHPTQPALLLINGPNLNLLGTREPTKYGTQTLAELEYLIKQRCSSQNLALVSFQSNHEGAILDFLHGFGGDPNVKGVIINAGAYTHTSVAIRDALLGVNIPFVEVHITNVHKRERFRQHSYLSDVAEAVICGLGTYGYLAAVDYFAAKMDSPPQSAAA
ncbi:hypothetical protein LTR70_009199 [Exophiala xenobiotica]|uniref:Catabolic 3-dehydroquinase n=1 Tax=Lithohypha guttulata TaxID=1690604 RepID=A0ABR0JVU3_9EURO|nr:hypothetical protein LTR24_009836 [Lithohypha guttulata]KAK5310836.1 hypothetical protein LTR70_009199 [Exophiala xenobiotica]